jgi:hypothetical protein
MWLDTLLPRRNEAVNKGKREERRLSVQSTKHKQKVFSDLNHHFLFSYKLFIFNMAALPHDALQIGTACGMHGYALISSRAQGYEIYHARVVDPGGTTHPLDVGIALAEHNGCDNINLAALYETIDWCRQGLQRAATAGLSHGWVIKTPTKNGVHLLSPRGEQYQTYWDVASNYPDIHINTLNCPWFLGRRQLAEVVYGFPIGWSASTSSGHGYIFDPQGNKFENNAISAGIAAGVLRPKDVLRREARDYQDIVRELHSLGQSRNSVMSGLTIANILGDQSILGWLAERRSWMKYDSLLKISRFFDMANNATALREAAVSAGVSDITRYETRMVEARA